MQYELAGLPVLLVPENLYPAAQNYFKNQTNIVSTLPERDDEAGWNAFRHHPLYFWECPNSDSQIALAKEKGCSRIALLESPPDIYEPSSREMVKDLLARAKTQSRARATHADLSVVKPPAGRPLPIPLDSFGPLGKLIEAGSYWAGTHRDFGTAIGLAILDGVTGCMVEGEVQPGHLEPSIKSVVALGQAGTGKTGALGMYRPAIEALEQDEAEKYRAALAFWEVECASTPKGTPKPEKPSRVLIRLQDYTAESAAFALAKNQVGALGWISEFASLGPALGLGGGEGYSRSGNMRAFCLTTMLDGGQSLYSRRSVGDEPLWINQFALPLATTTQPDIFAEVLRHPIRDGFADRFLIAFPSHNAEPVEKPNLTYEAVEAGLTDAFRKLRKGIKDLGKGPRGIITVPFEPEATAAWQEYAKQMRARARSLNDQVAGARIKATAFVARIATMHAYIEHVLEGKPLLVTSMHVADAKAMMRALLDHRAVAEATAFEPLAERQARSLAQAIVSREAFTFNPVDVRRNWRITNLRTEPELRAALLELQACGWIRQGCFIGRGARDSLPQVVEIDPAVIHEAKKYLKGK